MNRNSWHHQTEKTGTIQTVISSDVIMVIEAGQTGGSLDAGLKALDMRKPLFVPQYGEVPESAEGNITLLNKGASPLKMSKETLKPNTSKILTLIQGNIMYGLF